jgi:phage/conjugal plasmid C-4 type zinc finger TraR family protein
MSDVCDQAQRLEEGERDAAIAGIVRAAGRETNPFRWCLDCGDDIDPERRAALPSALRCLECQEARERRERGL